MVSNPRFTRFLATITSVLLLALSHARADVTIPKVFGDHMVLQQQREVPIWGTAAPGEPVRVTFHNVSVLTTADAAGRWLAKIPTGPATNQPSSLVIAAANTLTFTDVLVGEVWICAGQSNMEYPLNRTRMRGTAPPPETVTDLATREYTAVNMPAIRLLRVEKKLDTPDLPTDGWHPCQGLPAEQFSSVGYFFGKELHEQLNVPIGLIQTAWGGSRIEPWTPPDAYEHSPLLSADIAKTPGRLDGSPVGNYYRKLVAPIAPFAARGVIWYQGESNIISGNDGMRYFHKFAAFVNAWRRAWENPELSFIQVQLVPYLYSQRNETPSHLVTALPELWEAQQHALNLPHVGMVVTNDLADDLKNIHPWNKWEVGHRLALWALAHDYGRHQLEYSGPVMTSVNVQDGKAYITFDHVAAGLKSRDAQPLTEFTLAGDDNRFHPATARIVQQGNTPPRTIVVESAEVPAPKTVRFAWHESARPNLVNSAGLPAPAFRSDKPPAR